MFKLSLGRAECGHFDCATQKEWLVTNGLGGYASGTVSGANTRRYHGLLVAALRPPLERTVMVAKIDALTHYDGDGKIYPLATNEYAGGTVDPRGYRHIESFHLEGLIPVWTYALADARLEQRIWMAHGHNTTYLTCTLSRASDTLWLKLTPFCTYRDYHSHRRGGWQPRISLTDGGFEFRASAEAQTYRVVADRGRFNPSGVWYWNFRHQEEKQRGLDDVEDLFVPGHFSATLYPGETLTVICSTEPVEPQAGLEALNRERQRQAALLPDTPANEPAWVSHLALAADQFIVQRSLENSTASPPKEEGTTVIAGYPWFGDWGRDTMIALPGLTLATGRPAIAASILRTFARYISQGMLPNRFPDTGPLPDYNAVDATLWYFYAVDQYLRCTHDLNLAQELYPILAEIIDCYQQGTRFNIHVDQADHLLYAGEPGLQLTWMDAKVGNWVVTPRLGKPVEVNALWHTALRVMANLAHRLGQADASQEYNGQADLVAATFRRRFWFEAGEYLYDVIDGPTGELGLDGNRYDDSLRPNQILAVSLPFPLLNDAQAKAVVDICALQLVTSYGLRTLAAEDPAYTQRCRGDALQRDSAAYQGTVWTWLLGPFVTAHYRVYGQADLARSFLLPLEHHLTDAGLGSISETFDGDPPHTPRGCLARAWSVAEILRAWREMQ
jgi:predicted glycogen debranching enzyme